jgi:hypothetical protein
MISVKAAKGNFFDTAKVIKAVDKATRIVLSKFGAFVRTRSRSSIRKRKAVSTPGSPPSSHVGLLRRFIFFSFDPETKSVVIGPAKLNSVVDSAALPALEYGGTSTAEDRRGGKRRKISIRARPFMTPALEAEKPGLPAMWRDSVK